MRSCHVRRHDHTGRCSRQPRRQTGVGGDARRAAAAARRSRGVEGGSRDGAGARDRDARAAVCGRRAPDGTGRRARTDQSRVDVAVSGEDLRHGPRERLRQLGDAELARHSEPGESSTGRRPYRNVQRHAEADTPRIHRRWPDTRQRPHERRRRHGFLRRDSRFSDRSGHGPAASSGGVMPVSTARRPLPRSGRIT